MLDMKQRHLIHITLHIYYFSNLFVCSAADESVWSDSNGITCDLYKSLGFCKSGSYGPYWREDVDGTFADYADDDGFDAASICCECIPSTSTKFTHLQCPTRIEPDSPIWYDSNQYTCKSYERDGLCANFGYGKYTII